MEYQESKEKKGRVVVKVQDGWKMRNVNGSAVLRSRMYRNHKSSLFVEIGTAELKVKN